MKFFTFANHQALHRQPGFMSFQLLFDPISPDLYSDFEHFSYINQRFGLHTTQFPDWRKADIALIGLTEDRGNPANEGAHSGADSIRRALFGLRASHVKYNVVDLGNLRPGQSLEDSHLRLKEVVRTLLENNIFPLVFGGTHDHTIPMVMAYEELGKKITLLNIDSRSDTEPTMDQGLAAHHISRILTKHKQGLKRYIHLAYQTYLMDENILAALDQHHYFRLRLGELREDFKSVEPILRSADMISLDISAIRMSEAPANALAFAYGLTGEEACQMAWFAGCSSLLSSFGIFEMNPGMDYRETTAQMLGTLLWYFIEGYYHRADDLSFSPSVTKKHHVMVDMKEGAEITFYQSLVSGRWWVEIPPNSRNPETEIMPCKMEDYQRAIDGEIPHRWLNQLINLS